jgi:NAD(P)-dependent dehydrogenase (short-subunit alcohol dehydrogenase family)
LDDDESQGGRLAGQVAIVTGGGRGLGQQVARSLAAEGAVVAIAARSEDQLAETVSSVEGAGGRAVGFPLDVSDGHAVEHMISEIDQRLGPIELLVNNAAVTLPLGPAWEVTAEDWWRNLEVNVLGPFVCAHAVLPGMIARGRGRIINVASGVGVKAVPFGSAYCTSKAALIRLSEGLAMETAAHGVAVFAIDPGFMRTPMTYHLLHSEEGQRWTPWVPSVFGTDRHVPVERAAQLIVRLASGDADSLSGHYVTVFDDVEELARGAMDEPG